MHVNLLPVNLGYKGKAEVDNNFVSDTSGKVLDYGFMSDNFNVSQLVGNLPVYVDVIEKEDKSQFENVDEIFNKSQKSTVLRGRKLKGMEVDLNKYGFKGFLVEERDGFLPISEIDKLTLWNNGSQVGPLDKFIQGIQYASVVNRVHFD
ncbi:hypothetical protein BMR1_03g04395 [Babesia microti strain RI]|uniref:Uncharacterized protein n=1 Tax=Babesia microti (strain RI) TaxID=1133968 RepID=A0A1R4ACQ0_BABMR|nr:hypothetical protein BMR1_03g04395 [Babesia microti strain RI]SJK86674.1 hypothetical protein BMR1_03g04395 [Babesia microti strain RI]|eukprot:XP_021338803.1 hypothetical protein BMR1_03g04395 [Babesia microti strain RI]